ncbi:hypothetical protein [Dyadobacter crusticola]|uniref:hypothetical protein n=1 Tax=Dyadobacter crusticola TaxID=292407 RepID=UPI0004E14FB8|nr:hypothetical protein [Dyadobacter crusticola]
MKTTEGFQLIKGLFKPDEAKEVLLSLVNSKITFHHRKSFSQQERFGTRDRSDDERVRELAQTHQELAALIDLAKATGCNLKVHSTIQVELIPQIGSGSTENAFETNS